MLMKNSNYTIRNRTRDLPACSAVPQPTAPGNIRFSEESLLYGAIIRKYLFIFFILRLRILE
jgi:hypothetical protein